METSAGTRPPALSLAGLCHAYPIRLGLARREVLHSLDLELAAGASLGLVGPNGSGKSTLLRIIAGVEEPRSGRLEVLGGSPDSSAIRARIGFLSDGSPFPREMSAQSALELVAAMYGLSQSERKQRANELLGRVGLDASRRVALGKFSRGMSRRFGLAAALVHEPDLVLLDEPTAGLDALGFAVLEELLAEARARGASLIVASHILTDIQTHCDRLAVLVDGRVAFEGVPRDLAREGAAIELEIEGLSNAQLDELELEVKKRGGRTGARFAAAKNLVELYRRRSRSDPR